MYSAYNYIQLVIATIIFKSVSLLFPPYIMAFK